LKPHDAAAIAISTIVLAAWDDASGGSTFINFYRAISIAVLDVTSLLREDELARHRSKLVADRTRHKNRIHATLARRNIHSPFSDIFGCKGR
jgi:hypothetical protein